MFDAMITKCKFDKNKDFEETVPDLAVSIQLALTTGIVKNTGTSTPYSKLNSTDEVGSYLHDAIDIALAADRIASSVGSGNPE